MKLLDKVKYGVAVGSIYALTMGSKVFAAPTGGQSSALNPFDTENVPKGQQVDLATLKMWITNIANFLIGIGVVVGVIFIIWGGLAYMFAGGDDEKAQKAKKRLFNGVIGLLIMLGVGLIIKTLANLVQAGIQ